VPCLVSANHSYEDGMTDSELNGRQHQTCI